MSCNMRQMGGGETGGRGVVFEGKGVFLGGPPQSEECSKFAFELIQISNVAFNGQTWPS